MTPIASIFLVKKACSGLTILLIGSPLVNYKIFPIAQYRESRYNFHYNFCYSFRYNIFTSESGPRYCSYLLPMQADGTFHNVIFQTLRQSGKNALYGSMIASCVCFRVASL